MLPLDRLENLTCRRVDTCPPLPQDPTPPPSFGDLFVPDSLENRQRQRIEEQHVDIGRLTADIASFKRDQERLVAENGRLTDALADLQTQLEIVSPA